MGRGSQQPSLQRTTQAGRRRGLARCIMQDRERDAAETTEAAASGRGAAEAGGPSKRERLGLGTQLRGMTYAEGAALLRPGGGGVVQAKAGGPPTGAAGGAGGGGAPLPEDVRGGMEQAFGADFRDVRVHQGPEAAAMGAVAFAQGNDLHFQPGAYEPRGAAGRELLGHELTHVLQQRAGRVGGAQGKDGLIEADPALEGEADRLGAAAARGEQVSVPGAQGAAPRGGPIQRMKITGTKKDSTILSFQEIGQLDLAKLSNEERGALVERLQELLTMATEGTKYEAAIRNKLDELENWDDSESEEEEKVDEEVEVVEMVDEVLDKKVERRKRKPAPKRKVEEVVEDESEESSSKSTLRSVAFSPIADKADGKYEDVDSKIGGKADAKPSKGYPTAYIAQVPTHLGGQDPSAIAGNYEQGAFDDPNAAADRLRVAVGVNAYRDVADNNRGEVKAKVKKSDSKVRMGAFGFLWEPMWEKTVTEGQKSGDDEQSKNKNKNKNKNKKKKVETKSKTKMKASEVAGDKDAKELGSEYFTKKETHGTSGVTRQAKIPYGKIRDHIKNHDVTAQLTQELTTAHQRVFVHVGDDDAQQMKEKPGKGIPLGEDQEALGLLSRYDAIVQDDEAALLVSGGYEFRRKKDGGDLDDKSEKAEITLIAHQLDRKIRQVLADKLGPLAVYFPEPNTIYRVTKENSRIGEDDDRDIPIFHDPNDTKGGGSAESQQMVANLMKLNGGGKAIYDPRASLVTQTSGRFAEGENAFGKHLENGTVDPILVKHIVGQNQSHASEHVWLDSVGQHNKLDVQAKKDKLPPAFIKEVFEAFVCTKGDFGRKSRTKWSAEEFAKFLSTTIDSVPGVEGVSKKHSKYLETTTGKAVVEAAKGTNLLIVAAIKDTIERIKKDNGNKDVKVLGHDEKKEKKK